MAPGLSRYRATSVVLAACLAATSTFAGPETRPVKGNRVELGEVLPNAPESMHAIDICQAPPVGTSRLIDRALIQRQVKAAGFDVSELVVPTSVRVERAGRKYTPTELGELLRGPVASALPAGTTLVQVESSVAVTLEEGAKPGAIHLPKIPHRLGSVRIAFAVEFHGDDAPLRVPVTAIVQMSEHAAKAAVSRGARVQLAILRGSARIAAEATALSDGDVGDELRFRVNSTGKVLRGVVVSPTLATVRD